MTKYTETRVAKVNELRAQGMTLKEACKAAKINPAWYYHGQRSGKASQRGPYQKRKRPKLTITEIAQPAPQTGKTFVFYGEPSQIAELVRSLQ